VTEKLSAKQMRALPLLAAGADYRKAASEASVAVGTIKNWVSGHEPFKRELDRLRYQAYLEARERLKALANLATSTLHEVLATPETPPRERISAARTVLGLVHDRNAKTFTIQTNEEASAVIARILTQLEEGPARG
jgi:hypothetical protein